MFVSLKRDILFQFVFTDVLSNHIFVSKDRGQTIVPHRVSFTPSEVMFHPTEAEVLLIHDTEDPERKVRAFFYLFIFQACTYL